MTHAQRARSAATEHFQWATRQGFSTTDIAYSVGRRYTFMTETELVDLLATIWSDLQPNIGMRRAA